MPYGASTTPKRPRRKRQRADVAAHDGGTRAGRQPPRAPAGTREHRRGPIDAGDRQTRAGQRHSRRPVPQPSSSTGAPSRAARPPPERDVPPAERARVLPVVERRVVVPAFGTVSSYDRYDWYVSTPGPSNELALVNFFSLGSSRIVDKHHSSSDLSYLTYESYLSYD